MAYEGTISKGCENELRSVYCSESVKVNRLVAYSGAVTEDVKGTGTGFGFNVQYPTASTSLVCGVIWDRGNGLTGYNTGDVCVALRRGFVKTFMSFGTSTVNEGFQSYTSLGLGLGTGVGPISWTPGVCGYYLLTDAGTATTTSQVYVNTWA